MNSRERLNDIADFAEGDPRGDGLVALSKIDAAALRELDQLLRDFYNACQLMGFEGEIMDRAAKAGYGDK